MSTKDERSTAASTLGQHSARKRLGHLSAAEKSEAMRKVRLSKILKLAASLKRERPKSSDNWRIAQATFLAQNAESKGSK